MLANISHTGRGRKTNIPLLFRQYTTRTTTNTNNTMPIDTPTLTALSDDDAELMERVNAGFDTFCVTENNVAVLSFNVVNMLGLLVDMTVGAGKQSK